MSCLHAAMGFSLFVLQDDEKSQLAAQSLAWNLQRAKYKDMFPHLHAVHKAAASGSSVQPASAQVASTMPKAASRGAAVSSEQGSAELTKSLQSLTVTDAS